MSKSHSTLRKIEKKLFAIAVATWAIALTAKIIDTATAGAIALQQTPTTWDYQIDDYCYVDTELHN